MNWIKFFTQSLDGLLHDAQNALGVVGSQLASVIGPAIASTATISPVAQITHITATAAIATITPPYPGYTGTLTLIPDAAFTTVTTGNIALASTGVLNKALEMAYDGSKWYPSY